MPLYCPRCGDVLANEQGTYFCKRGDMYFSPILASAYRKHFEEKTEPAPDSRWKCVIGGNWYCPQCGKKMEETEGKILCRECGVNLGAWVYHIIEHHPHRTEAGTLR